MWFEYASSQRQRTETEVATMIKCKALTISINNAKQKSSAWYKIHLAALKASDPKRVDGIR